MKKYILKLLFAVCLIQLFGCKSKPIVITQHRDSIVFRKQIDTLRIKERDSVVVRQINDTIYIEKYKTLFKDHTSLKHDTITKYINNTIKSPEVRENKGKNYIYAIFGVLAIIVIGILLGFLLIVLHR